jgi:uncharacterized membrane protein
MDFLPTPLHPLIVHLPIAMTVLLPLFGLGALIAIRRGSRVLPVWALATAMIALTLGSGLLAKETGEDEEEAVEKVVAEESIGDEVRILTNFFDRLREVAGPGSRQSPKR